MPVVDKNGTSVLFISLPNSVYRRLRQRAQEEGMTLSQAVSALLRATFVWPAPEGSAEDRDIGAGRAER